MPVEALGDITIRDGEDLGFGSDSSDIEEAPSDYSEEFGAWEIFGEADISDPTAAVAQPPETTSNEWFPFNSQEVMMCLLFTVLLHHLTDM
jgi:hypothetical protein